MATEKFQMLHPDPNKKNVNIDREKYEYIKKGVLATLEKNGSVTPTELFEIMTKKYAIKFDGKIGWYTEGVKLDLEARGIVVHDRKTRVVKLV